MWPYNYDPDPVHKTAPSIKINFEKVQILTKERASMLQNKKNRDQLKAVPSQNSEMCECLPKFKR
jgi:hypothetical protein